MIPGQQGRSVGSNRPDDNGRLSGIPEIYIDCYSK